MEHHFKNTDFNRLYLSSNLEKNIVLKQVDLCHISKFLNISLPTVHLSQTTNLIKLFLNTLPPGKELGSHKLKATTLSQVGEIYNNKKNIAF